MVIFNSFLLVYQRVTVAYGTPILRRMPSDADAVAGVSPTGRLPLMGLTLWNPPWTWLLVKTLVPLVNPKS